MTFQSDKPRLSVLSALRVARASGSSGLREEIRADLSNLLGTVHLGASVDLSDFPYVQRSVLNYGMSDLSRLTVSEAGSGVAMRDLRAAITAHEPRIVAKTLSIVATTTEDSARQAAHFSITAEMRADPVDLELAFDAHVDVSAARVAMSAVKVT